LGIALGIFGVPMLFFCLVGICAMTQHAGEENHLFEHGEPRNRTGFEHALHNLHSTSGEIAERTGTNFLRRANSGVMFVRRGSFRSPSSTSSKESTEEEFAPVPEVQAELATPESVELGVEGAKGDEELTGLVDAFKATTVGVSARKAIIALQDKVDLLPSAVVMANESIKIRNLNDAAVLVKGAIGESSWNAYCRPKYLDLTQAILRKMDMKPTVARARSRLSFG
jgi:hypothetical protein